MDEEALISIKAGNVWCDERIEQMSKVLFQKVMIDDFSSENTKVIVSTVPDLFEVLPNRYYLFNDKEVVFDKFVGTETSIVVIESARITIDLKFYSAIKGYPGECFFLNCDFVVLGGNQLLLNLTPEKRLFFNRCSFTDTEQNKSCSLLLVESNSAFYRCKFAVKNSSSVFMLQDGITIEVFDSNFQLGSSVKGLVFSSSAKISQLSLMSNTFDVESKSIAISNVDISKLLISRCNFTDGVEIDQPIFGFGLVEENTPQQINLWSQTEVFTKDGTKFD